MMKRNETRMKITFENKSIIKFGITFVCRIKYIENTSRHADTRFVVSRLLLPRV